MHEKNDPQSPEKSYKGSNEGGKAVRSHKSEQNLERPEKGNQRRKTKKNIQTPGVRESESPVDTQNPRRTEKATVKRTCAYCGHADH